MSAVRSRQHPPCTFALDLYAALDLAESVPDGPWSNTGFASGTPVPVDSLGTVINTIGGASRRTAAALNLAVQNRRVGADRAIEWKLVKQHRQAGTRRQLFLDLDQRRQLIQAARGAVGDLVAGVAFTGARPGDLRKARRSHFDARTSSISFFAKNHPRTVPLPPMTQARERTLKDAGVTLVLDVRELPSSRRGGRS